MPKLKRKVHVYVSLKESSHLRLTIASQCMPFKIIVSFINAKAYSLHVSIIKVYLCYEYLTVVAVNLRVKEVK